MNAAMQRASTHPLPSPPVVVTSIRPLEARDRPPLAELIAKDGLFTLDEVKCALELIDAALVDPRGDYRVLVAAVDDSTCGYVCYGPTPMTDGTWDLYWLATHPAHRGRGLARSLVAAMENDLRAQGGARVRVETSQQEEYSAAHRFYDRLGYPEVARLRDFYKPGDDLIIMLKVL